MHMKCVILAVIIFCSCLSLHAGELIPKGTIILCTTSSPLQVGRERSEFALRAKPSALADQYHLSGRILMRVAVLHNLPRSQAGFVLPYSGSEITVTTRDISRGDVVSVLFTRSTEAR